MKRKFRKFQEGGEVDIPRRKPMRDQYGNIVRSGTGEPIMTAGEMDENDLRELNPEAMTGFEAPVKTKTAPSPESLPPEGSIVKAPLASRDQSSDAEVAQEKTAGVSAPQNRSLAAVSAARPPAAVSAARSPAPPSAIVSGGGRGIAAGKTADQEAMLTGGGRGKEAGKAAAQEMELLSRQKRLDPETIKKMEREQALQGVYPEMLIPGLGRVFGRGAAAGRATKATRQEPKVPSGGAAKPRKEPTLSDEVTQTGSRQLTRQAGQGALAQRGETVAGKVAERARDRGFVPGERRALEGKQPGQLQEAQQAAGRVEKYMGPAQEVRRELSKPPLKQLPKPAIKEPPKPKKTRKEDDDDISRFEGESGAIRSGSRPGKKRFRKDDDPMGRFAGESPSYMNKGGKVQKAPSPPDMGSSKYEPDLNKPKPKKKAMSEDMDMFMARSGGLAKKIDGIALRGKTRGKMY